MNSSTNTFADTNEVLAEARKDLAEGKPAETPAQVAANTNAAPGNDEVKPASHNVTTLTAQQHLHNAGIMYAKAAACFEAIYMGQVMEQQAAVSR